MVSVNGNCGDLNFSGHILLFVMGVLFIDHYGPLMWRFERYSKIHLTLICTAVFLGILQSILILASRHHYTVDIVIAVYTAPMLWHYFLRYDMDVSPDLGKIESELARESTWPRWLRISHCILSFMLILFFFIALVITLKGNLKGIAG